MLITRTATGLDIPFLARIIDEASLPPHNHSFWDEMLQESEVSAMTGRETPTNLLGLSPTKPSTVTLSVNNSALIFQGGRS